MKTSVLLVSLIALSLIASAQITLKFTAVSNGLHVNIDSVRVTNLTHSGDTVLHWPDTMLVLGNTGIQEVMGNQGRGFSIQLGSANPVSEPAIIQVSIPASGNVNLKVTDISGKSFQEITQHLSAGIHQFGYSPSYNGVSLISATYESEVKSLKIICFSKARGSNTLDYIGIETESFLPKLTSSTLSFLYSLGDSLRLTGWYNGSNGVLQTATQTSLNFTFGFGMNYPCPGLPQFTYGGQTYNTVQIGTQCWMRENLNIGTMVSSTNTGISHSECSNNGVIEKYCYNNDSANCLIYGGLYDWDEMMGYSVTPGIQGICPTGWHIPTDAEWCILTTYLDPTVNCEVILFSGTDPGRKLKEIGTLHWTSPNDASNESGFTALGAGWRNYTGYFSEKANASFFWTSSKDSTTNSIFWFLYYLYADVNRYIDYKTYGLSIRCIKSY